MKINSAYVVTVCRTAMAKLSASTIGHSTRTINSPHKAPVIPGYLCSKQGARPKPLVIIQGLLRQASA